MIFFRIYIIFAFDSLNIGIIKAS